MPANVRAVYIARHFHGSWLRPRRCETAAADDEDFYTPSGAYAGSQQASDGRPGPAGCAVPAEYCDSRRSACGLAPSEFNLTDTESAYKRRLQLRFDSVQMHRDNFN